NLPADTFAINENSPIATNVGFAIANDIDTFTTFTYTIVGGADSVFSINPVSGLIRVLQPAYLDLETTPSFNLMVSVSDGGLVANLFDTATFTINLIDVNEKPYLADIL